MAKGTEEKRLLDREKFMAVLQSTGRETYAFSNEPVAVDPSDVEKLMDDIRRESRRLAGLAAVYIEEDPRGLAVGPKRLVAVYDEETVNAKNQKFDEVLRVVGTRNILSSEVVSIDRHLLDSLSKLDCLAQLRLIYGEKAAIAAPRDTEVRFFNISRVQDLLITGYVETFFQAEVERQVDTAVFLARLVEFSRLIDVVKGILRRDEVPAWDALCRDILRIARDWFKMGLERYRLLMTLIRETFVTLFEVIAELDAFFARALLVNMKLEETREGYRALVATDAFNTVFVENWQPHRVLERMISLRPKFERFTTILPAVFAVQLLEYGKANNVFCSFIKSVLSTEGMSGNMERSFVGWERAKLLNHYWALLVTLGIDRPDPLVFGCNLRPGGAFSKAANLVAIKRNRSRGKGVAKVLREEPYLA